MACLFLRAIVASTVVLAGVAPAARSENDTACAAGVPADIAAWRVECDAAIASETDDVRRAEFLFRRAYISVEQYRYDEALSDLNDALAADPDNPLYLHERAYVNGELSQFAAALVDLDRQVALQPDEPTAYRERAHARHFSGDLKGSYEDRDKEVQLLPESPEALLFRSEQALWIGRFVDAEADATRAEKLAKAAENDKARTDAAALLARAKRWRKPSSTRGAASRCTLGEGIDRKSPPTLIGDCTQAFLSAKDGPAKANALNTRSVAWLVLANDQASSTQDLRVAVALDPKNADRYINLGFSFLLTSHSWAARREFDRALALVRHPYALAGRARARMNLGDPAGARGDALASHALEANEAAAWVLADLAYDEGDLDAARGFYLDVFRLGSRDDGLIERLKELGVSDPAKAAVKP
jgi:tetratricopeptide (TPR) repeat protein